MSPSKQVNAAGLASLSAVARDTPWPLSTLNDMARNYPERFEFIIDACACMKLAQKETSGKPSARPLKTLDDATCAEWDAGR